jgi:type I restriction enzyme S subunit
MHSCVVVFFIEIQSQKIDKAISQQEQAIDKLKKYRMSLIDSCVIGKVKVNL